MNKTIDRKQLIELGEKVPDYMVQILEYCVDFFEKAEKARSVGKGVDIKEISELYKVGEIILNEYLASILSQKNREQEKQVIQEIKTDIRNTFNMFYNRQGERYSWTQVFTGMPEDNIRKLEQLISAMDVFIETRIYSPMIQTYNSLMERKSFLYRFVVASTYRAGRHPHTDEEKKELDELMGKEKSEEKEEK